MSNQGTTDHPDHEAVGAAQSWIPASAEGLAAEMMLLGWKVGSGIPCLPSKGMGQPASAWTQVGDKRWDFNLFYHFWCAKPCQGPWSEICNIQTV